MPAGETGKRKLPDLPDFSKTPDKRPSVQSSSSGSSAPEPPRRSLFQCARKEEERLARGQLTPECEESSCNWSIERSAAASSAAGPQAMAVSKILFGPLPSREALAQYFNAAETQVMAWFDAHASLRAGLAWNCATSAWAPLERRVRVRPLLRSVHGIGDKGRVSSTGMPGDAALACPWAPGDG